MSDSEEIRRYEQINRKCIDKLNQDWTALYDSGDHSDVVLLVGGREFCAHKLVLIARSPVFAAMFSHDWNERNNGLVEINDDLPDPDVFDAFLRFLYTGQVSYMNLWKYGWSLFEIADKVY